MAVRRIGARGFDGRESVVELPPMIGTGVGRIDAELLDGVDGLEHAFDLGPTEKAQRISRQDEHTARSRGLRRA
jgi:hypothetical protein